MAVPKWVSASLLVDPTAGVYVVAVDATGKIWMLRLPPASVNTLQLSGANLWLDLLPPHP